MAREVDDGEPCADMAAPACRISRTARARHVGWPLLFLSAILTALRVPCPVSRTLPTRFYAGKARGADRPAEVVVERRRFRRGNFRLGLSWRNERIGLYKAEGGIRFLKRMETNDGVDDVAGRRVPDPILLPNLDGSAQDVKSGEPIGR